VEVGKKALEGASTQMLRVFESSWKISEEGVLEEQQTWLRFVQLNVRPASLEQLMPTLKEQFQNLFHGSFPKDRKIRKTGKGKRRIGGTNAQATCRLQTKRGLAGPVITVTAEWSVHGLRTEGKSGVEETHTLGMPPTNDDECIFTSVTKCHTKSTRSHAPARVPTRAAAPRARRPRAATNRRAAPPHHATASRSTAFCPTAFHAHSRTRLNPNSDHI